MGRPHARSACATAALRGGTCSRSTCSRSSRTCSRSLISTGPTSRIGRVDVVTDASALLAVVLNEPERDSIIVATQGASLIAPQALPFEIGNALIAMRKRRRIEEDVILPAWKAARQIPVRLVPVEMEAALTLALAQGIYAYDAYYLQCALSSRRPLVSLDGKMRDVAKELGIQLLV